MVAAIGSVGKRAASMGTLAAAAAPRAACKRRGAAVAVAVPAAAATASEGACEPRDAAVGVAHSSRSTVDRARVTASWCVSLMLADCRTAAQQHSDVVYVLLRYTGLVIQALIYYVFWRVMEQLALRWCCAAPAVVEWVMSVTVRGQGADS
jgi:hypothetical protein